MTTKPSLRAIRTALVTLMVACALSACEQLRSDLADLISPPTDTQVVARMIDLTAAGRVADALAFGEKYLANNKVASPSVHAKLAELYLDQGDAQRALRHLEQSNTDPPSQSGQAPANTAQRTQSLQPLAPLAPPPLDAMARVGPDGIEAQAGNARASIKP